MEIPSTKFTKQCWREFFGREMEEPSPECFTAELCDFANYLVRKVIAAQQKMHPTPESLATSQAVVNADNLSRSDSGSNPAQARVI